MEHRGLEGNPPELNIFTGSEGAKDSLAKSGTCVVPEVTFETFVTKGEFKAFADMVFTKLDELKSTISVDSQANSQILAEALKANTEALNDLRQSSIQQSAVITKLTTTCAIQDDLKAFVESHVDDLNKLREEIKDITRSVIVPFQPQASTSAPPPSTSAPDLSAFATKTKLETMGRMVLSNLNLIGSNISQEGKKLTEDLKKTIATIRFKSDLEVNKLSLATEDVLRKITKHVNGHLCKRRKRKEPATCQGEASQKRAHHDDQDPDASGPGYHEGEKASETKSSAVVIVATPLQALPLQKTSSKVHKTQNLKSCASEDRKPIATFVQGQNSAVSQKGKVSVGSEHIAEGLTKFVEPSSPELMPTAPTPVVQFQSLDPVNTEDISETPLLNKE
ncbi:hypothetical protein L6452_40808 [Arctium lappa]|uniref:Uncharacterized protein n=1 Tax=Arctium lappa TaxID=4217 RepID=A0ACB8XNB5_ARCLA|nr:hypothetical protein L6452_40808 [Arctium lappa]